MKRIVIPLSAILLLIALPSYFMVVNNLGSSTDNLEETTKTITEFTVDEVTGQIAESVVFAICGAIVIIAGFFGIKLIIK